MNAKRRILDTFANERLQADNTFKARLRHKIATHQTSKKRFALSSPFVSMAVMAAVLIVVLIGISNRPGHFLLDTPQASALSPAELVSRARQYYESFDPRGYSFYSYESERTPGPQAEQCRPAGMAKDTSPIFYKEINRVYMYAPQDSTVEAHYSYFSSSYNTQEESYHSQDSDNFKRELANKVTTPLQAATYRIDGITMSVYILVDRHGKRLPVTDVSKSKQNGREVYAVYFRYDPTVMPGMCKDEIISVVFDAKTYAVLEYDTYIGNVSPENLVVKNHAKINYKNINEDEALQIMTAAGFDMDKALENGKAQRDGKNWY
ncbi:MAG TPA: hypothetical protein VJ836_06060 [Candidatus Saccharimonadales bacterium]|nr:hypothetical protein [Candidatus Saccharimonadales bacterium]